jgi:hypothetical protein
MRGSSVHFKRIASAIHAVSHASRDVAPEYLLPEGMSLGTHVVIDDAGQVQRLLEHKLSLASRQAKAIKDYSPMWEGVINLPDPADATPQQQIEIVKNWCAAYEKMTGHKVIRADVHLDEGFVDAAGKPRFNAHAHVMCDRTDDKGKVKKLTSTVLREVQNMTAEVTTLARGLDARTTGRKHIGHQHFRFDAEKNRLDVEKPKAQLERLGKLSQQWSDADRAKVKDLQAKLDDEPARLAAALAAQKAHLDEQYRQDREALKASGEAKQRDYQDLKAKHQAALADLATAQTEADKVPKLQAEATKAKAEIDRLTTVAAQVPGLETKLVTAQSKADLVPNLVAQVNTLKPKADRVQGLEQDLAKAKTEADKVAELVAQVNAMKPKADRVQGLEKDLAKAQTEAGKVPALVEQLRAAQEQVQKTTEKLDVLAKKHTTFKEKAQGVVGEQNQKIAGLIGELEEAKKPVLHQPAPRIPQPNLPTTASRPLEASKTAQEPPKRQEEPVPEKTPREAFLALWAGIQMVALHMIDGARLDAADDRLGLFSWPNRVVGGRNQALCEVPFNKVMPKIGEVFDFRAIPGRGRGGIGD